MTSDAPPARRHAVPTVAAIGALVLLVDESTKAYAARTWAADPVALLGGRLVLTESRNPGAAFGTATSLTPLLTVIAAAAVAAVLVAAPRVTTKLALVALGLALGGALGNLTDRMLRSPGPFRGHVVDWIQIGWWPTFNLADSALMTAAGIGVVLALRSPTRAGTPAPAPRQGPAGPGAP